MCGLLLLLLVFNQWSNITLQIADFQIAIASTQVWLNTRKTPVCKHLNVQKTSQKGKETQPLAARNLNCRIK